VEIKDLRGLFHLHSNYSDGTVTIAQWVEAARAQGYQYLGLSDHSQSAGYASGLKPDAVQRQHREIDALNETLDGFHVFKGIESDIRVNGALDYEDSLLAHFDFIIASIHSKLEMTEDEATRRIIKAIENPYTTILGHPTGRLLLSRDGYPLDMDKVLDACAANDVAVEINGNCHRLDLDWRHLRRARQKGVKLCIGPDAHSVEGMNDVEYGLGIARKGWLEPADVLNCMTAEEFQVWLEAKRP